MPGRISLEGKVAVVTGAGRGLGRAYVELLAERGARVVVNDLGTDVSGFGKDSTIAEQVADLIRSRGGEAIANNSDVSTPGFVLVSRVTHTACASERTSDS
jgi:NAD(P)-dependent dehydrogenase (short-subunit alcohol dehydrogenase family)